MPKRGDKSPVSFGRWFLTIFMIAIPCIGFLYMVFGAIVSASESRRNFYRAHLAWLAIIVGFYLTLFGIGIAPDVRNLYDRYMHDRAGLWAHDSSASAKPRASNKP